MNDAQYAIQELKSKFGYSDGDIAAYAGISRQSVINIRHGNSSGKKVIGKLWSLKSLANGSEDVPPPTPKQSTTEKLSSDKEETFQEDNGIYIPINVAIYSSAALLFIVLIIVVTAFARQHSKQVTGNTPAQVM